MNKKLMKFTPRHAEYKGETIFWSMPKRLYHISDSSDEKSILAHGLYAEKPFENLATGVLEFTTRTQKGIYLFNEKVEFSEMTGRKVIGKFTIFEVLTPGIKKLDIDLDWEIDPEWHSTHSDKYPQHQYIARQPYVKPNYLQIVARINRRSHNSN